MRALLSVLALRTPIFATSNAGMICSGSVPVLHSFALCAHCNRIINSNKTLLVALCVTEAILN